MTRQTLARLTCLSLLAFGGGTSFAQDVSAQPPEARIEIRDARVEDGRVVVDFYVLNAINEETLALIHSGVPVKFRHRVEVLGPRKYMLSPRNVLARSVIETRVAFDALTGRYELSRLTTLKKPSRKKGPPPYEEGTVSEDSTEMRRWMTEAGGVVLYDPAKPLPEIEMRVAVESSIGRNYFMWIFPTKESVTAVRPVEE